MGKHDGYRTVPPNIDNKNWQQQKKKENWKTTSFSFRTYFLQTLQLKAHTKVVASLKLLFWVYKFLHIYISVAWSAETDQ